ncbi:MAG TPA: hypothetical protein VK550_11760 [Polyangiaceae bacterium]|nr:hypothetical protein [Polyangiaceae bacterium]
MVKSTAGSSSTTSTPYFSWPSAAVVTRTAPDEMPAAARKLPDEERLAVGWLPEDESAAFDLPERVFGLLKLPLDI